MTAAASPRKPALDHAVDLVLAAVDDLRFDFGYLNGGDVGDAHVRVSDPLAAALDALAKACGRTEVSGWLDWLRGPVCQEWLGQDADGVSVCVLPVAVEGDPCSKHAPDKAAELDRCDWAFGRRQCRHTPADGSTRCSWHRDVCWIRIKKTGEMCMGSYCRVPRHVKLREQHQAATADGAAGR
jgi:hypothetical protein